MGLIEILEFNNPNVIAIVIGALFFVGGFVGSDKFLKNKGVALLIGLCLGALSAWFTYKNGLPISSRILAFVIIILFLGVLFMMAKPFFKFLKRTFGRR